MPRAFVYILTMAHLLTPAEWSPAGRDRATVKSTRKVHQILESQTVLHGYPRTQEGGGAASAHCCLVESDNECGMEGAQEKDLFSSSGHWDLRLVIPYR